MKNVLFGFVALFSLASVPALAMPPSTDCFTHEGVTVGCAAIGAYPPGYAPSQNDVRRRVIIDADGTQEPTKVDYWVGGDWNGAARATDASAPQENGGFFSRLRFYPDIVPGGRCRTYTYYHEARYGRTKSRSRDYRVSCD